MNDHRNIVYQQGWNARFAGEDKNPYFQYSSDYTYWNDGWFDANDCLIRKPAGMGYGGHANDYE